MKLLRSYRRSISSLIILVLTIWQIGQPLHAASYSWTDVAGNSSLGSNWFGGVSPNVVSVAGDTLNFNNAITAPRTVTLDGLITGGTLNIGDTTSTNAFTLAAATGGYLFLDASSGSAAINKTGDGLDTISTGLQFNDTLAITNNATAGTLTLSGALRSVTSDISFNGTGAVAAGSTIVSGVISTAGNLIKNDAGTTLLSGANIYAGATTINGGRLILSNAASLPVRSAVTVATGAILDFPTVSQTIGSLSGAGTVTATAAAATRTLTVGRDDTSTTFNGQLLGPATKSRLAITKIGAGTLTLAPLSGSSATAAGDYTGATVINGGALKLDFSQGTFTGTSMLAATTPTIAGGNLEVKGRSGASINQTLGNLTIGTGGGSVIIDNNGGTATRLNFGTITSTAAGGSLLVNSPAGADVRFNQALNTAATINGRIVFTDGAGNFNWAANTGVNTTTVPLATYTDVAGGAPTGTDTNNSRIASVIASETTTPAGNWTTNSLKIDAGATGQSLVLGANTLTLTNGGLLFTGANDYSITSTTGTLKSNTATASDLVIHNYGTGNLTVGAIIANGVGASTLTTAGTGKITLTGANTFTGAVIIGGTSTLSFSNVAAAGAGSLGNGSTTAVTIRDGATLQYTGPTGLVSGAAATAGAHTFSLAGGNATIDVATAAATDVLTLNGVISGAGGLAKSGIGVLAIGASATYTGPTFVNAGTLRPAGNVAIGSSSSPLTVGASGTLDINGTGTSQTLTIGSLSGSGTVLNSNSSTKTLAVGGDNTSTTFSGTFGAGGVAGNVLTKQGAGIFTLTNAVTSAWTGGNNVNGGVLRLGASNTLNATGTTNIGLGTGPATLELGAGFTQTLGAITIYGTGSATTSQGNVLIGSGSTLTTAGTITVNNSGNPLGAVISGAGTLSVGGAAKNINVADSSTVPASAYELTISVPIASVGAFGITKQGTGNLLLSGNNTYTGTTTIGGLGGTTTLSGDNTSVTGATTVNSASLMLDYGTNPTTKKLGSGLLSMLGGSLVVNGSAGAPVLETVAGNATFAAGGRATIAVINNGQDTAINLGTLTRATGAGTVRFVLPSGAQTATNGILTGTGTDVTTGLLGTGGGWATVTDGTGTYFATKSGNNIVAISTTTQNDVSLWTAGQNLTDDTTGFTGSLAQCLSINSLRFNAAGPSTVTLGASEMLQIASGGVLQTSNVNTGVSTISGGTLTSGTGELIFTTDGSQRLDVTTTIAGTTAITKSGNGTLRLGGTTTSTGTVTLQSGTVELTGGNALGDTAAVTFLDKGGAPTLSLLASQTETIGSLSGGGTGNSSGNVLLGSSSTLTINQTTAALTYSGLFTGGADTTLVKSGAADLTYGANSATSFTGALVINQGQFRLAGDNTGRIGSTVISVNNPGSQLHINHSTNNIPDRVVNTAVITLNNTAPGLGLFFRDSDNTTGNGETVGAVALGAGNNVIASDYTGATSGRHGTLTFGAASGANLVRSNNATAVVVGKNLGGVVLPSTAAPGNSGRLVFTNAITGANAAVGGAGADGTSTASIFPYLIGEITTGTPTAANVGNSFVRVSANGLRPLSIVPADLEYIFDQAGYNGMADSTANNVRFTTTPGATLLASSGGTRTINALAIDSTAGAVSVTGPGADTLHLTSGALLSTGAAANNTSLTGFAGITTGTNSEYIVTVTNNQFTLGSPLTSAAVLTKSGAGTLILTSASNAHTDTYFNQGTIQADALNKLGTGSLNFFGGTLKFAGVFDPSAKTINLGTGGGTFDTNGETITLAGSLGSGTGGFTKTGAGDLILDVASSYTGSTSVLRGGLTLGHNNAISSGNLTLESTLGAVTLDIGSGHTISVANLTSSGANTIAINGSGTINATSLNLGAATVQNTVIFGGSANLTKSGTTTTTINNAANTYTGYTWIQDGTLSIKDVANAGSNSSIGAATGTNAEIRLGNLATTGTLQFTGAADSTDRPFGLYGTTGGGIIDNDGTGALTLSGDIHANELGSKALTFQGTAGTVATPNVFSGSIDQCLAILSVTKAEAGVWSFTGANSYTGGTTITAGTLIAGNNSAFGTGTLTLNAGTLQGDGTARTLTNTVLLSNSSTIGGTSNLSFSGDFSQTGGSRTLTINNTGVTTFGDAAADNFFLAENNQSRTLTLTVGTGASAVINATIQNGTGTGVDSLTKGGAGNLTITENFAISGGLRADGGTTTLNGTTYDVDGSLQVGRDFNGTTNFNFTTASGSLTVGSGSSNVVEIGYTTATSSPLSVVNFNLAGTNQFTADVGNFRVGDYSSAPTGTPTLQVSAIFAANNTITAATDFVVGDNGNSAPGVGGPVTLQFGSGSNTVTTPSMTIGGRKGPSAGVGSQVTVAAGGTLTIDNGVGSTNLFIGNNIISTGVTSISTLDTTGAVLVADLDQLIIGQKTGGGVGSSTATLTSGTSSSNAVTANTVTIGSMNGGGAAAGTLNWLGGSFTAANDVALATFVTSGTSRGTLNVTGGTVTVNGNITKTASTSSTGIVVVNGGTLDMTSGSIASSQLAYRSGTLSNVSGITLDANAATTGTGNTGDALIVRDVTISAPITLSGATASNVHYENAGAGAGATLSGALDLGSAARTFNIEDSAGATIELTQSGALTAAGGIIKSGAGVMAISGTTTSFAGNTAVQNGRLILAGTVNDRLGTTGTLTMGDSSTSGVLQLGGGTGISNQTFTGLATSGSGTSNAIIGGAATNSTLTVNQSTNTIFAGALGGAGTNENNLNLVKSGSGELSLTGVNTYNGSTTVSGGRLLIDATTALPATTTSLTVDDGAELFLRATNPAANVVYGFSGTGNKITVGTTTGATLGFALDGAFNSQLFLATGQTMALTGTLTTKVEIINTPVAAQDYILINGTDPNSLGATGTFSLSPTIINGGSFTYTLRRETNGGTNDQWIITPTAQAAAADVWWKGDLSGGGIGVWAASTTNPGNETNWDTTQAGGADALVPPDQGSHVHFSANSAANFATTLGANLTVKKLTFESGSITSGVSVGGANTLTVGHTVNGAGTAGITVATGAGAGAITISAPVVMGIAQSVNVEDATSSLVFTGGIGGAQALTINDSGTAVGTVRIGTTSATYSGATTVAAGRLILDGTDRLPTTTNLTLGNASTAATLQLGNGAGASNTTIGNLGNGSFAGNTIVGGDAAVSTLTVTQGTNGSFDGVIGGGGTNENNLALLKAGLAELILNAANTYTGGTTVANGTLKLGSLGSITGALTVSASAGVTATFDNNSRPTVLTGGITLGGADATATPQVINTGGTGSITLGGNVAYLATNNPLGGIIAAPLDLGTTSRTITADDSTSAAVDLTISGNITAPASGNGIGLTFAGTGVTTVGGSITLTASGDNSGADITKNGTGTINLNGIANTIDDFLHNDGTVNVGNVLTVGDDYVADNTGVIANFNVTGALPGTASTSNGLYGRSGATINLNATDVLGALMDFIILGDDNQGTGNLVLASGTTNTTPSLQLGFNSSGEIGNVTGPSTLNVSTTLTLNNGLVSANLNGAAAATKDNNLTVTLSGNNNLTGTTLNREGTLVLDFTTNAGTDNKMGTGAFTVGSTSNNDARAITNLIGNATSASTQTVASLTVAGGPSEINLTSAGGQDVTFAVAGALTRTGGTLNVSLPNADTIFSYGGPTTNTNGIVGGWMTINDRDFATISGGQIVAASYTTTNNAANWGLNQNITNSAGFSGIVGECNIINSLRFDAAGVSNITVDRNLHISSGGIMENLSVGNNGSTISGGTMTSGAANGEFIFTQNNTSGTSGILTISSRLISGGPITKNGTGVLLLNGTNNLTGTIFLDEGTLRLSGGSAVSNNSTINIRNTGATLELAASQTETIGSLAGDSGGAIILNTGSTLTVTQASTQTLAAVISGAGTFVKSGGSTLTLSGISTMTGTVRIEQGQIALTGGNANLNAATAFVLNGSASSLQNNQDQDGVIGRMTNAATVTLNNTAGGTGFAISKTAGTATASPFTESVGALTLGAGHNVITATSAVAAAIGQWTFASLATTNPNRATALVRGLALGSDVATQKGRIVFTAAPSGAYASVGTTAGGNIGTTKNLQIVPYIIGDVTATGLGNSFVTNTGTNGLRPLEAAEYDLNPAALTAGNNTRFTATTAVTSLASINSLVLESGTAISLSASPAGAMEITSGAILAAGAANHTIGSSFSAITTGGGRDYTVYVPLAAQSLTMDAALTSAVPLVKSGAGTLSFTNASNAFTDVYLNQGTILIDDLDKIGTGNLGFFGGTLKLAAGFADDLSTKTINIGTGGGNIDVSLVTGGVTLANGIDDTTANSSDTLNIFTRSSATGTIGQLTIQGASTYTGTTIFRNSGISSGLVNSVVLNGNTNAVINGNIELGDQTNQNNNFDVVVALGNNEQIVNTATMTFRGASGENAYFKLLGFMETIAGISDTTANGVIENRESDTVSASGTLILNSSSDFSYNGFLRDNSAGTVDANPLLLTKQGTGTQTLSGANIRHSGTTTISAGTLVLTDVTNWQSAINNNATLSLNQTTGSRNHTQVISGTGTLNKLGAGTIVIPTATVNTFSGQTNIEQGVLSISSSSNLGDGSATNNIRIANNATLQSTGANVDLGANRSISMAGNGATIDVTGTNKLTVSGAIIGDECHTITKTSTGLLVINNATNAYSGPTNVNAGILQVGSGGTAGSSGTGQSGSGLITVASGAALAGTGTIQAPLTLASGSTLLVGDVVTVNATAANSTSGNGTLTFTAASNINLNAGSTTNFDISTSTNAVPDPFYGGNIVGTPGYTSWVTTNFDLLVGDHDRLVFSGANPTIATGAEFVVTGQSFTGQLGQIFNLIDWVSAITGFATGTNYRDGSADGGATDDLDLPTLSGGLVWDISMFQSHGIVVVVPEPSRALLLFLGIFGLFLRRCRA